MIYQDSFIIQTRGRGTTNITAKVQELVRKSAIQTGLCHVFQHHTSASLVICENADPAVRHDLETFMARIAPDGDPSFTHRSEGPDDMSAHVRNVLTQNGLSIPVSRGHAQLGTWQGVYLWEHRTASHSRHVTVTIQGE
jgi:secondary thiamine-phosphate synthase enzyme